MKWIKIEDRKPMDDQTVLCWHENRQARLPLICWYDEEIDEFIPLFCDQEAYVKVTHWMPLPKPPEE